MAGLNSGDVYSKYLRSCEKRNVEPLSCVVEAFKGGCSTLDLSGNCISVENCKILARALRHDHPFKELNLSDCLIGDEGLSKLMEFLMDDTQITSIILKGNSIKSKGAAAISNLLKRNLTLQKLSLEWNNIGLHENDIKLLCEALSVNASLCTLDLRSNHIDHVGGSHLSRVLATNTTLVELDVRWNNLGILGGRSLLAALKNNSSLTSLRVDGNNIPSDIMDAIGTTLSLHLSHHVMEAQHLAESKHFSAQLNQLQSDAKHKMIEVLDTLDSERTAFLQTAQLSQCEITDLKVYLEERDVTIARLETKLLEEQSTLRDALSECAILSRTLEETKTRASSSSQDLQHKIEELEEGILSLKEASKKDLLEFSVKERDAEIKIHTLTLEAQTLESKLETVCHEKNGIKQNLTSRITTLEDMLSEKEARSKSDLAQQLQTHRIDLSSCRDEWKEKEMALTKEISESERCASKLKEELRSLKQQSGKEKGEAAEEKGKLQQALKLQAMKNEHLNDQIEELKNNHEVTVEALRSKFTKQTSDKARLEEEIKTLHHKIKAAYQEFEAERSEISRVKKSQKERVKELLEEEETLQRDNKLLTRSLEEEKKCRIELEKKRESEIEHLRNERSQLQLKVEQQKAVIQRFQQEEQHRTSELKAALNTYFNGTPKLTDLM